MKYIKPLFTKDFNILDIGVFVTMTILSTGDHFIAAIIVGVIGFFISAVGEVYTKA